VTTKVRDDIIGSPMISTRETLPVSVLPTGIPVPVIENVIEYDPIDAMGDRLTDLINRGFPKSSLSIVNNVSVKSFTLESLFKFKNKSQGQGQAEGSIKGSMTVKDLNNLVVSGETDTNNYGAISVDITDPFLANSTLHLSVSQGVDDNKIDSNLYGKWVYRTDPIGVSLIGKYNLNEENRRKPSLEAALAYRLRYNLFASVGAKYGEVNNESGFTTYNGRLAYVTALSETVFTASYKTKTQKLKFNGGWFQTLSPLLNFGVDFSVSNGIKNGYETKAVVAGEYQVDSNTTLRVKSTTKAEEIKVHPNIRLGLGLTQRVNSSLSVTLGADFNARHIFNAGPEGAPHSFGFEVNLS